MRLIKQNLATIVCGLCIVALFVASLVVFGPWRIASDASTRAHDPAASAGTDAGARLRVVIHDADGGVSEYPLDEDRTVEVITGKGRNVIAIEGGKARMAEADCPNGTCLRQEPLDAPGEQLICLPHELWVEVVATDPAVDGAESDVDFVAGRSS